MDEEIKIHRGTLSEDDIDVLSGMMIIFTHAFEKLLAIVELHYEAEYRASKEYQYFCNKYGKAYTDNMVKTQVQKIVRGEKRNKFGRLLKIAKDYHREIESLTTHGMLSHKEGITDGDSLSAIIHDVNFICYAYALMANCPNDDDEIKILSVLKALAKGNRVSDNLLSKLEPR